MRSASLCFLATWLLCVGVAAAAKDETVEITLVKVWASKRERPGVTPKELEKHRELFEKYTRKKYNYFRREGKPERKRVALGNAKELKLSTDDTLVVTPVEEAGQSKLKFYLRKKGQKISTEKTISREKQSVFLTRTKNKDSGEHLLVMLLYGPRGNKD